MADTITLDRGFLGKMKRTESTTGDFKTVVRVGWAALAAIAALNLLEHLTDVVPGGLGVELNKWTTVVVFFGAAALVWWRAYVAKSERAAWACFGAGLFTWGAGALYLVELQANSLASGQPIPLPSWSDPMWLATYPLWYAGLILLFRSRVPSLDRRLWADGLIGALSVAAIGAALVFQAVLNFVADLEKAGVEPAGIATQLAYPLADLFLLSLVIGAIAVNGWRVGAFGWIVAGLALFAVGDSLFLYLVSTGQYQGPEFVDGIYPAAAVLIVLVAWLPHRAVDPRPAVGRVTIVVPMALASGALAVTTIDHFSKLNIVAFSLATAAIVAVFFRLAVTFAERQQMLERSRRDALTDALTGLPNRRKLMDDLEQMVPNTADDGNFVLAMFDLDGFKNYNDTFGHPAGDRLLRRLGRQLAERVVVDGTAYRVGGDEFCIVYPEVVADSDTLVSTAADALSERGDAFTVTCSYGMVAVPREANTVSEALSISDQRLYMHKNRNVPASSRQSAALLKQLLVDGQGAVERIEQDPVADLASSVAREIGVEDGQVLQVRLAAELRDVGMVAMPAQVARSHGALSDADRTFFEQHPVIGERMVAGAPALGDIAPLVRSTHESFDGNGFPDGLVGEQIPLASRIVAACDAFQSMVDPTILGEGNARVQGTVMSPAQALEALQADAGTRFDPAVVEALVAVIAVPNAPEYLAGVSN